MHLSEYATCLFVNKHLPVGGGWVLYIGLYRVLKKSCRKIIANFFKIMGDSDFLSLLGASHMWSI